jgi:pimeloyl-ACP methyl ester carboxylesterase
MLNQITHGEKTDQPDLMIIHGLYGSGRNWGVISKRLSNERRVIAVDQRNHGHSPWYDQHGYTDMAEDLAEVIRANGAPMDVIGHSMGGKAAMVLALKYPELVNRLVVADIAPVSYEHTQSQYIKAMQAVDLDKVTKRSDAEEQLRTMVDDPTLPVFFTQSLDVTAKKWRLNLDILAQEMPKILSFPDVEGEFSGPVLFLSGANSQYVLPAHRALIKSLFPKASFAKIPGAGHWLHAEKPREFEANVRAWLKQS